MTPTDMDMEAGGHRRLLIALERAGYDLSLSEGQDPIAIEARPRDLRSAGFAIYIRMLESPHRDRAPGLPRSIRASEAGLTRVLLDYIPERGLYAALPRGRGRSQGVTFLEPENVVPYLESLPARRRPPSRRADWEAESILYSGFGAVEERMEAASMESKPVTTGFAPAAFPSQSMDRRKALEPCTDYVFWFGLGAETGASIEVTPASIPEQFRRGARLSVEVYGFEGELALTGETRGEIEVMANGGAAVAVPAARIAVPAKDREERLFFQLRTPGRPGRHRLRCNLYFGSTLVQSRLVTAGVGRAAASADQAIESVLDYRLSGALDLASLVGVPGHDFSLEINGNEASHQFRFYRQGEGDLFKSEASIPADRVKRGIGIARKALRMVSWKSEGEWDRKVGSYRYRGKPSLRQLSEDLGALALAGANLYSELARQLTGGVRDRRQLEEFSRIPGKVQIATGVDGLYVPAGLFYDHQVERPPKGKRFKLCEDFAAEMKSGAMPLERSRCMVSGCGQRDEKHVVCPSGFWGFRHEIGWPTSTEASVTRLEYEGNPAVLAGVSTDVKLTRRQGHIRKLEELLPPGAVTVADNRDGFDRGMKARGSDLVYLYCHGGLEDEIPYLALGKPASSQDRITYDHLRRGSPWGVPPPRPLVFINGCHTTALGPEQVLDLVTGFVDEAEACGVIGTELTVFEPLACDFAEAVLEEFLSGDVPIGAAVRRARLELLRANNPLGLAYVPFIAAETKLCEKP